MLRTLIVAFIALIVISGAYWSLSRSHTSDITAHGQHSGQQIHSSSPKEAGQAGFAAIAEIVVILQADPKTDWSSVNIAGLREHLLDMQALTTGARVTETKTQTGLVVEVTGDERAIKAAKNMVPAHANVLSQTTAWRASTETTPKGVTFRISAESAEERQKLRALGFFGIMATGAHHQQHHLAMAKGQSIHAH